MTDSTASAPHPVDALDNEKRRVDTISTAQLRKLRMYAQGLRQLDTANDGHTSAERITATARRMLAVQGQDWRSARWALGVRTPATTQADVHEAFNNGSLVRSWPMRGTVHLLAAEDIGWIQSVTNHRVISGAPKRREFLGISDEVLEKLVETSVAALQSSANLDRDELAEFWSEAGIAWQSNWRYHLVWWLCQNGLAVFGPVGEGDEPRLVATNKWISEARTISGDDALAELAARYASARGAVSARDFAWWTGLTASESKRGLALATANGQLTELLHANESSKPAAMWAHPETLERFESAHDSAEWLLLPAFDEHLLGYQDRAAQLEPEHFAQIVPGRNGMFLATVVHDGRVVGTWKRGKRGVEGIVARALTGEQINAKSHELQRRATEWAMFHKQGETALSLANE